MCKQKARDTEPSEVSGLAQSLRKEFTLQKQRLQKQRRTQGQEVGKADGWEQNIMTRL